MDFALETKLWSKWDVVIGVDEAGRGPLAGPVCCGAFTFVKLVDLQESPWMHIADSKCLTECTRETLFDHLMHIALNGERPQVDFSKGESSVDPTSLSTEPQYQSDEAAQLVTITRQDFSLPLTPCSPTDPFQEAMQVHELTDTTSSQCVSETCIPEICVSRPDVSMGHQKSVLLDTYSMIFSHESPILFTMSKSDPPEIDSLNILNATLISMSRAVYTLIAKAFGSSLRVKVLVDGNRTPPCLSYLDQAGIPETNDLGLPTNIWNKAKSKIKIIQVETIVKGDTKVISIAAASIIAKVSRDRILRQLAVEYPLYSLEVHKGYPTPAHKKLLSKIGPADIHRLSFEPCYSLLYSKRFDVPKGRDFQRLVEKKKGKRRNTAILDSKQPKLKFQKLSSQL